LASRFVLWSKVLHRSNSIIFLDGQQKKRSSKQLVLSCPSTMPTV